MTRRGWTRVAWAAVLSVALAGCGPKAVRLTARDMAEVPGGVFVMGADGESERTIGHPAHRVSVKPFRIGRHEVTFAQYDEFATATGRPLPDDAGWGRGDFPVINVDWADIQAFIAWLNARSGRRYRLPSEAEWEYAARAGATTPYWWGPEVDPTKFNGPADKGPDVWDGSAPVGSFPPNAFGLYDVTGNVFEVTADCRHPTYDGAPADGSAWVDGPCDSRVMRGGSWYNPRLGARLDTRSWYGETIRSSAVGFRLAESLPEAPGQRARDAAASAK